MPVFLLVFEYFKIGKPVIKGSIIQGDFWWNCGKKYQKRYRIQRDSVNNHFEKVGIR